MRDGWSLTGDLAAPWTATAITLTGLSVVLLLVELISNRRARGSSLLVAISGVIALGLLLMAVLRPVRVFERASTVAARLLVLADASRSIDLPGDDGKSRRAAVTSALAALKSHFAQARVARLSFSRGAPITIDHDAFDVRPVLGSDLSAALESIARGTDEQPQAIVVLSDGRLDRPVADGVDEQLRSVLGDLRVPVHTVSIAESEPRDASIRAVKMAGAVVAHNAATLSVEIGCGGGLSCGEIAVRASELHGGEPPVLRAQGTARIVDGRAQVDLDVTLDRAGKRILEVSIDAPQGDAIPENDRRFITVDVARDRVRLLHVAGRPTYDVRALRTWLKSDASVDVVAFFILRTRTDEVVADQEELALIPFPVDELFTKHLHSFDAVVLQDFDASPGTYGLSIHLPRLASYVRQGGGLIMVGGPNAFVSGSYAGTPLAEVLPVSMQGVRGQATDLATFVPRLTKSGRRAPVLEPLATLIGERWPEMPGTNVVAQAREDATVLLEHPTLTTMAGSPMPVLALGEYKSGRSIALTVDGTHLLQFSSYAVESAGRAHGALWDGLLGWLMRDPRFEPAVVQFPDGCIAGVPTTMKLRAMFADDGATAAIEVASMASGKAVREREVTFDKGDQAVNVDLGALDAGGYTVTVRVGRSAPSRYDFACEVGGDEWADSRPDPRRLQAIAKATGGVSVKPSGIDKIPLPKATRVVAERRLDPLLPPWCWTALAAAALGGHWLARRKSGLM
jgi:uncharacterized membrane protein